MSEHGESSDVEDGAVLLPVRVLHAAELSKLQKDLLWGAYVEMRTHARHGETLRASGTSFVLVIASALIAVINGDGLIESSDLPLTVTVIALGMFSTLFSAAYVLRYGRSAQRAETVRDEMDRLFFDGSAARGLGALAAEADRTPHVSARMRFLRRVVAPDSHVFWMLLPAFIFIMGVWLSWTASSA